MAVDTNHKVFSSEPWIMLRVPTASDEEEGPLPMFIAMDPPKHDGQRKAVSGAVAPANLAPLIRERAARILDDLPVGKEFDWVCAGGSGHSSEDHCVSF